MSSPPPQLFSQFRHWSMKVSLQTGCFELEGHMHNQCSIKQNPTVALYHHKAMGEAFNGFDGFTHFLLIGLNLVIHEGANWML